MAKIDRQMAEPNRFQENLRMFFWAVEQTTDLVLITNRAGVIEYVNPAFTKLTGYTPAEVIGKSPNVLQSGRYDRQFYVELWQSLLAGQVVRTEFTNRKKDGQFYHQSATITPIKDEQGVITHFVATGRDMTRQVETELEEVRLQERLRRQHDALIRLSTHRASAEGRLSEALSLITQTAAEALAVERVNIWRLSPDGRELRSLTTFERSKSKHSAGQVLRATDYPFYFAALETVQVMDAADVSQDARTAELNADYWQPLGISSSIEVPVRLHGQVIGVVGYEHVGPNRIWTPDEITFASQLADLVAQAFLHARAKRRSEELESTRDILRALNSSPEISEVFSTIAASLRTITGCEWVSLVLFDEQDEWFTVVALHQPNRELEPELRGHLADSAATKDILAGRHRRTPDLTTEKTFPVEKALYEAGYRSRLCLPLRIGRGVLGALNLAWPHPTGYNTAHLPLLDQVADAIALAIERRRLFEETRSRALQQEALNAVIAAAMAAPDMLQLAETALDHTLQALNLEIGGIWVVGQRAYRGLSSETGQRIVQATQTAQLGFSGPIIVEDWAGEAVPPSVRSLIQLVAELGLRASLSIPILTGGKRIGAIFLAAPTPRTWTTEEVALAEAIGRQLGNAAERLHLLERTRKQARRVQQIMDTVPEGVIFLDAQQRIALANPAAEEYLALLAGVKEHDVLTHLGDKPLDTLLQPEPAARPYHEIKVNQPSAHVFELVSRPLADEVETGGWVLLLHDVTESRRLQEQAQEQERLAAVGQLAAGIAHDFNNLLTGIIGFAELLQMRIEISEPGLSYLNQITKSGRQAANLIGQILDFSRKSVSQQETLDLVPFLKESLKFLERTIPESIRIVLEVTPGEFVVKADPTKIQQVLTNLAVNARDAMPAGGELRFQLACLTLEPDQPPPCPDLPPGDWILLAVSDTGSGIPEEIQDHIFEPFFTTKERGKGTGLGLAQVYGIIKQHQGYIEVSSRPAQGTTFSIFLPAVIEPGVDLVDKLELQTPRGHGETILLVEDEPNVLEVNQIILAELGYRTINASNGKQALEIYARHKAEIALVLTDMVMPEMDGLALIEALKAENPDVNVVIITGYPLQAEAGKALSQGRVRWLQKPVTITQMAQAVSQALAEAKTR